MEAISSSGNDKNATIYDHERGSTSQRLISSSGDLTSIGTLFAFVLVCIGVWIMRRKEPGLHRPFRTPFVPVFPLLGVLVCGGMIVSLDHRTQLTAFLWMLIGLIVYFSYGRSHSQLASPPLETPAGIAPSR